MEECAALLSQKANSLRDYLEATQALNRIVHANDTEDQTEYFAKVNGIIRKRGEIISEIDKMDGLLVCKHLNENKNDSEVKRQLWLCRKLLEQISDIEKEIGPTFGRQIAEAQEENAQSMASVRTASAYMQLNNSADSNFEWEK